MRSIAVFARQLIGIGDGSMILLGPDIERVLGAGGARTFALEFAMGFFVCRGRLQRNDLRLGQHEAVPLTISWTRLLPYWT